jgi:hypothetical protein
MDVCKICRESIAGIHISTETDKYHQDCFKCLHCLQPFEDDNFTEADDGFYCEKDYSLLFLYLLINF